MSCEKHGAAEFEPRGRPLGVTERGWCKAVLGGTGLTVLALHLSKDPEKALLQNALHNLQNAHPILNFRLHYSTKSKTFSFIKSTNTHPSSVHIKSYSLSQTKQVLLRKDHQEISPFQVILEHELNNNTWFDQAAVMSSCNGIEVFFTSLYTMPGEKWVLTLRFHTAVCDRTTAVSLLRELKELVVAAASEGGDDHERVAVVVQKGVNKTEEGSRGIEDCIPKGKTRKTLWAHGMDMLGYSLNSFRLTNLRFNDVTWPRCSEVVRLKMNPQHTDLLLANCKSKGIKLCGALAAAGLIAVHSFKHYSDDQQIKKYGVVTLTDCRSVLDPPLSVHHFGFHHAAILNILDVKGEDRLWELAGRSYMAFANSKKRNKHFSDMADLNFLMCKAIDNPSLTTSSSLRSSFISVFEDPVIEDESSSGEKQQQVIGLEDYMGCASVHGIGPSIALFDTIREGELDCACVYPSPLHSREQMNELVDEMKRVLIDGTKLITLNTTP